MRKRFCKILKARTFYVCIAAVLILFSLVLDKMMQENAEVALTQIRVESARLPKAFDGFRIAQISDLHNAQFGQENEKLLKRLRDADADIIVITGDMIDSRRTDVAVALRVAREAVKLAPTYYIQGNHEVRVPQAYAQLKAGLTACGVTVLEDESVQLVRGEDEVALIGILDSSNYAGGAVLPTLAKVLPLNDEYKILLSHQPQYFKSYVGNVDLVFCGHAHGGQIRLPLIGGLLAPGQGWLPAYDGGLYTMEETSMVVSRGIGNSIFPLRVNNPPEIVVAELVCKQ